MSRISTDPNVAFGFTVSAAETIPENLRKLYDNDLVDNIMDREGLIQDDYGYDFDHVTELTELFEDLGLDDETEIMQVFLQANFPLLEVYTMSRRYGDYDGFAFFVQESHVSVQVDPLYIKAEPTTEEAFQMQDFINTFFPGKEPAWMSFYTTD